MAASKTSSAAAAKRRYPSTSPGLSLTDCWGLGVGVAPGITEDRAVFEADVVERGHGDERDVVAGAATRQFKQFVDELRCGDDRGAGVEGEAVLHKDRRAPTGLVSLLGDRDVVSLRAQADRRGQPAEAATDDDDPQTRALGVGKGTGDNAPATEAGAQRQNRRDKHRHCAQASRPPESIAQAQRLTGMTPFARYNKMGNADGDTRAAKSDGGTIANSIRAISVPVRYHPNQLLSGMP